MKKVSLLLGTLGGALGAYVLSNNTLRNELSKAKDPEAAAKALGKHLQKDSKKFVKDVKAFVESDDVQQKLDQAKEFTMEKYEEAKKNAMQMMKSGGKKAAKSVKKAVRKAKKAAA